MGSQENRDGSKAIVAAAALLEYRRVKLDGSQNLVYAGLGEGSIGTLEGAVALGVAGAVRLWSSPGTRKMVAAGAFSAGASIYGAADGKVDDVASGDLIGTALEAASGDGAYVEILPSAAQNAGAGKVYANVADSAAGGAGSAAEFDFDKSFAFQAADLKAGDILKIRAQGVTPNTHTTDTFLAKLFIGTEEIAATATLDVADGDLFTIDAEVIVREGGATGKLEAAGFTCIGPAASATAKAFSKAEAAEDLSGAITVKVTGKFSVADAGNNAVLRHLSVVRHQ